MEIVRANRRPRMVSRSRKHAREIAVPLRRLLTSTTARETQLSFTSVLLPITHVVTRRAASKRRRRRRLCRQLEDAPIATSTPGHGGGISQDPRPLLRSLRSTVGLSSAVRSRDVRLRAPRGWLVGACRQLIGRRARQGRQQHVQQRPPPTWFRAAGWPHLGSGRERCGDSQTRIGCTRGCRPRRCTIAWSSGTCEMCV
jgi:hypothetical protein